MRDGVLLRIPADEAPSAGDFPVGTPGRVDEADDEEGLLEEGDASTTPPPPPEALAALHAFFFGAAPRCKNGETRAKRTETRGHRAGPEPGDAAAERWRGLAAVVARRPRWNRVP